MKLWLIRHAKSAWSDSGVTDFERTLNQRGERDGPRMIDWFTRQSDPPTWIWTSSATRALATARFARSGFSVGGDAVVELDELYLADADTLLDVIHRTPSEVQSVAIIAHNPGLTRLTNILADKPVTDNLPTLGTAKFAAPDSWQDVLPRTCTLEVIIAPKSLPLQ
jgi:phosphohistidine phosphatase